ncbi:hypothetical protein IWW36_000877 [Coemansia brasiliensis]|uniref:DUF4246 domain-containing protein n=1 Tax=Coemansia brasiliensis TaxID=2650707 RepID=A0A9W8IIU8_9FUNG|nr:hypothetical protein IWW36_000877 [Coemansia brasiliensis]
MEVENSAENSSTPLPGSFAEFAQEFNKQYKDGAIYSKVTTQLNTKSEQRVRRMSGAIRSKEDWMSKMMNPEIRIRWANESKEQGLTEREIDYVFEELAFYAALHVPGSNIKLSAVENVWISDDLIESSTTEELKKYAAILEDKPEKDRDYHPNTNNQVLNLVHPSLFPLIYQRSRLLAEAIPSPEAAVDLKTFGQAPGSISKWDDAVDKLWGDGNGGSIFYIPQNGIEPFTSEKFCWLPSEFRVAEDGATTIESYINNLHPVKYAAFYPTIARIFSKFVPMLEHVVTDMINLRPSRVTPDPYNWFISEDTEPEDYEASDYDERHEEWEENRTFVEPQPDPFVMPDRPMKPYSLRGRRLQAIFKMSNIHLTPDNPEYEGGNWHVEAMSNERIVATGIYYYDVENITESNLSFRESVEEYFEYEQGDRDGVNRAYGIYDNEDVDDDEVPLIQHIGSVEVKNGRCIVFPNIYQHQVSGFKLADPTKPGHRKIMAFFFIDPTIRIPSTEVVPPQQRDWWFDEIVEKGALNQVPLLVQENISRHIDYPISLEEAKKLRLQLMEERSNNNDSAGESMFAPNFYLCEH